jgi:MOSC domain-containing protein YiiM
MNVVVGGDFLLAAGTDFGPYDVERRRFTDAAVMVTRVNEPCVSPARMLEKYYPVAIDGVGKRFVRVAQGRRGFVGMVVKGGTMAVGEQIGFVPFGGR